MLKKLKEFWRRHFYGILAVKLIALMLFFTFFVPKYFTPIVVKLPCFSAYGLERVRNTIGVISTLICVFIIVFPIYYSEYKEEKAKKRLLQRTLFDYQKKHQSYVDLVQSVLAKPEYSTIDLDEKWVKDFDLYIQSLAQICKSSRFDFTDFDVASCLMCALMSVFSRTEKRSCSFAFECVRTLISEPKAYEISFLLGDEAVLETIYSYQKVELSALSSTYGNAWFLATLESCFYSKALRHSSTLTFVSDFFNMLYWQCYK
ncbi:MAG: hypothetical protein HFJ30_05710 [Clostridia bacterium]|jgi:hypothetical protein|nr:hypothetical protein [Clostridia bacterium]MCI9413419.1 hypothetical protein [Clostridia bacterium]